MHKRLAPLSLVETYTVERLPVIREMLSRTTVLLDKTMSFRADGSNNEGWDRPKILHQLGVNCRWSPIVHDEQPGAAQAREAGAYLEEDPSVLYAGDRAPEAPGLRVVAGGAAGKEETTSLFKVFGPTHHTALLFSTSENKSDLAAVLALLRPYTEDTLKTVVVLPHGTAHAADSERGAHLTVVDTDGYAFDAYPPASNGFPVIIVRPDGVVGAVVRGVDGVKAYLSKVVIQA